MTPATSALLSHANRRDFLVRSGALASSLVIGLYVPIGSRAASGPDPNAAPVPNVFIRLQPDGAVVVIVKFLDMGQGIVTGVATVVAEELDADWSQVRYEYAPANAAIYANSMLGVQGVGSSTSIPSSWLELRKAGAAMRAMLVAAAAKQWSVAPESVTVHQGRVLHGASGRSANFGELAAAASKQPVPRTVALKDPSQFRLIGSRQVRRLDSAAKTAATETFGLDVRLPGMLYAVLARPPRFGATLVSFDPAPARRIDAVKAVVRTPYGIAVLATDTWSAIKGREALRIEWNLQGAESRSTPAMFDAFRKLLDERGAVAGQSGDAATVQAGGRTIEAEFEFPFLAHAPMEPLNAVVEMTGSGATLHTGCQFQTIDQMAVAQELGLKPEQVKVVTYMAGGSFGRRANPAADYVREAAAVLKASGGQRPVQVVWTRQDDLHGGYYRSMFMHRVKARVLPDGAIAEWDHRVVGHSIGEGTPFGQYMIKDGVDYTSVEGANQLPYRVGRFRCDLRSPKKTVPVLWWRSVGYTHATFAVETVMDDLAAAAGKDPVAFRLAAMKDEPRLAAVLKLAAERAGWGTPLPPGRGRGVAAQKSFGTYVAHVAEVSVDARGTMKVERLVCAVDCGIPVNPDLIDAQMEGGAALALTALFYGQITFKDGEVEQNNFDGYPLLRFAQMPKIEVHIVPSAESPTGVGEPPVPTVAPAVANALFAATGRRSRKLPLVAAGIKVLT